MAPSRWKPRVEISRQERFILKRCQSKRRLFAFLRENLSAGVEVSGANFAASVHLGRVMVNGESFPAIDHGELELRAFGSRGGGKVDGEFFVMFAGGRDLYGTFAGEVQEVLGE